MNDCKGRVFRGGAEEFRQELIKYSLRIGFKFKYRRNDNRYIHVVCHHLDSHGCDWFIKASRQTVTDCFVVSNCSLVHKCVGKLIGDDTSRFGPKIMGSLILGNVRSNPHLGGKDILSVFKDSYGIEVPYWKAYRTVEKAKDQIFGSYDDSYAQLRWYCAAVERTNPGSVVELDVHSQTNHFRRVFISFKACMDGFTKCRPMLFIDGTFCTGRAKGTVLVATAKDGNNGLFPVAYAVVASENIDNWVWFLTKIRDFVRHPNQIFYISDRNLGLMSAFNIVFEKPLHFFCLFHLLTNLKGRFSKGWTNSNREMLGEYFRDCAYAPNLRLFEEKLAMFKELGGRLAEEWIDTIPVEKWAVAYSPHITRYEEMTSNAAESFNSWIKDGRSLPITHMLDFIRLKISGWQLKRSLASNSWTTALCPVKEELWHYNVDISRSWSVIPCPSGEYLVGSSPSVCVDLLKKTCSCYQWQIGGFPCPHAASVINKMCPTVFSEVDHYFFASTYRETYSFTIHPIPETERFETTLDISNPKILPPVLKRKPGRPKKSRVPSYGEFPKKKSKVDCH